MSVTSERTQRIPQEEIATVTKVPSHLTVQEHPLHPMLVHFPIAFLSTPVLTDALFWWTADEFWAIVSFFLIAAGFLMGTIAAATGTYDFLSEPQTRLHPTAWNHFLASITLISLAATNVMLRWDDPIASVLPWGIVTSAVMFGSLAVAGYLGGKLVYHYLIGTGEGRVQEAAERKLGQFRARSRWEEGEGL